LIEESDVITPAALPPLNADIVESAVRHQWTLDDLESRYIREILRQTKSNYSRAAKILGINRKTLLEKRKRYGID
jgi:two-component system response regulator AtoC